MTTKKSYDIYIGLDVHKDTISIALANPERQGEIRFWVNIDSDFSTVRRVRQIARSQNLSTGVVSKYIQRAQEQGLGWPLPDDLTDQALQTLLQPPRQ